MLRVKASEYREQVYIDLNAPEYPIPQSCLSHKPTLKPSGHVTNTILIKSQQPRNGNFIPDLPLSHATVASLPFLLVLTETGMSISTTDATKKGMRDDAENAIYLHY